MSAVSFSSLLAKDSLHPIYQANKKRDMRDLACASLEYWPAFLIAAMAVVGAFESSSVLKSEENTNADIIFFQHASDRATVLIWELQRVLGDLQTVTAYMSVSYDWREDYFRSKFKNLTAGILDRSPGTQGLTWVPMVWDPAEREYLEDQQARQLNLPSPAPECRVGPGGGLIRCFYYKNAAGASLCSPPTPAGGPWGAAGASVPHAFFPVVLLEPVNDPSGQRISNAPSILYDLSSNAARNASISKAILQNAPSATSRLLLVQAGPAPRPAASAPRRPSAARASPNRRKSLIRGAPPRSRLYPAMIFGATPQDKAVGTPPSPPTARSLARSLDDPPISPPRSRFPLLVAA